jgi:hypothetical protein
MRAASDLFGREIVVPDQATTWDFTVRCGRADRVYLQLLTPDGSMPWIVMRPLGLGAWFTRLDLTPGSHWVRYLVMHGQALLNGGAAGLEAGAASSPTDLAVPLNAAPDAQHRPLDILLRR